jgi:hypothetical protein
MAIAYAHAQDAPVYPGDVPANAGGTWVLILGRDLRGMVTQTRFQRSGKPLQRP